MVAESLPEILSTPCPAVTVTATVVRTSGAAGDWGPGLSVNSHMGGIVVLATLGRRVDERSLWNAAARSLYLKTLSRLLRHPRIEMG